MSALDALARDMVQNVYAHEGPREHWKQEMSPNGPVMSKVIAAGRVGLVAREEAVNKFLKSRNLPRVIHIQQVEFEDAIKHYLVLKVSLQDYKNEIQPVQATLASRINDLSELALACLTMNP